ncbi:isocitrate/isopropylmalate family dehydrogenase [Labrys miyagiensis]|nr:isocitrate/isopropylmalate family dehydrogenase [Labrys miyagiensis]
MLADALSVRIKLKPECLDTTVAANFPADILSDLAGAPGAVLALAPTANIDPEQLYPVTIEPIHGSAFDIAGKGISNTVATFWAIVQTFEHRGDREAADRLLESVQTATTSGAMIRDLGGTVASREITNAVHEAIREAAR